MCKKSLAVGFLAGIALSLCVAAFTEPPEAHGQIIGGPKEPEMIPVPPHMRQGLGLKLGVLAPRKMYQMAGDGKGNMFVIDQANGEVAMLMKDDRGYMKYVSVAKIGQGWPRRTRANEVRAPRQRR